MSAVPGPDGSATFGRDATDPHGRAGGGEGRLPPGFHPERVVAPSSPAAVSRALAEARTDGLAVMVVGSRRALAPLPPPAPWMALSLEELSGVEEHEPGDLTFTARAGTSLGALDAALAPHGQWLPVDPAGGIHRTLGGLVATGLGGSLHAGYGAVRDQVLGLSLVTGDGRVLRLGGRVMKNVAGFDLVRLAVGSRGSLGVVVSVSMRVFPRPPGEDVLVLEGAEPETLLAAGRAVATAPVVPASGVVVGGGEAESGAMVVRVHGAGEARDADRATLEQAAGVSLERLGAEEAGALLVRCRDGGASGALAFRQAGLPAELPERWRAFRDRLPGVELRADLFSGVLRGRLSEASTGAVEAVRSAGLAGGRPVLFTALAPELWDGVEAWRGTDDDGGLGRRITARFDPDGVLSPALFGR